MPMVAMEHLCCLIKLTVALGFWSAIGKVAEAAIMRYLKVFVEQVMISQDSNLNFSKSSQKRNSSYVYAADMTIYSLPKTSILLRQHLHCYLVTSYN
jgi:hypothetical protein